MKEWIDLVETEQYLSYDQSWTYIPSALAKLQEIGNTVLVTLRRSREGLEWELERLGLDLYLDKVLSSGEQKSKRWQIKSDPYPERRLHTLTGRFLDWRH